MRLRDLKSPFGGCDRNILELSYATGIRRSEVANLDVAQPRQSMPMKQPKCYNVRTGTISLPPGMNGLLGRVIPRNACST